MRQLLNFQHDFAFERLKNENKKSADNSLLYLTIEGLSHLNEYVPFYIGWAHKGVYKKIKGGVTYKTVHYSIPLSQRILYLSKSYNTLYHQLEIGTLPKIFQTRVMEVPIYVMKGLLFELKNYSPVIHFLVAIKSDYLHHIDKKRPDAKQFSLLLSQDFSNGKSFGNIYKKMRTEIIIPLQDKGVDVIVTNDINKWCYNNNLTLPKFNSFEQRSDYLTSLNKKIFYE